jgi:hypothetical protein
MEEGTHMATIIRRLVPRNGVSDAGVAFESAAREALQAVEDEDLAVTFSVWEDGDGAQIVCRVETPPGDPLSSDPPWRWWSPLFRTPEELRTELSQMVARRLGNGEAPALAAATGDAAAAS